MLITPAPAANTGLTVRTIPWVKLLQAAVWCSNVTELTARLDTSKSSVLDSIEALNRVETVTLGEVFRLRELASA
jgi:hypothetical protein